MEIKHTPGPCFVKSFGIPGGTNIESSSGRAVAAAGVYSTNMDQGAHVIENAANAKLIAAAPDLLEALMTIINDDPTVLEMPIVRDAITKATE